MLRRQPQRTQPEAEGPLLDETLPEDTPEVKSGIPRIKSATMIKVKAETLKTSLTGTKPMKPCAEKTTPEAPKMQPEPEETQAEETIVKKKKSNQKTQVLHSTLKICN